MIRYTPLLLLVTLLFMGCNKENSVFTIDGELKGMKGGDLYIYNPTDPDTRIDTLKVIEGRFKYAGATEDTVPLIILFPNAVEQVVFVSPGKTIKYKAATNDLKNYKTEGTEENEQITEFRQNVIDLKDAEVIQAAKQFILDNPQSAVSIYLFDRYFLQNESPNPKTARQLLKLLKQHHPTNYYVYAMEDKLKNIATIAEGKKIKDVELMPISKETCKLWAGNKEKDKDTTVIFFWASWLRDSYDILYKIRNMQKDKGEGIRFVGISLDNQRYRWEELVRRDSVTIEQYCDGLSWSSPVVSQLALGSLPLYLITDKSHTVLFMTNEIEKIKDKLKKRK